MCCINNYFLKNKRDEKSEKFRLLERNYFCKNCDNKSTFKTLCVLLLKAKNNILADQN